MKKEKKKQGGKRAGAGRKPSGIQKESVTVYTDVSRFGGKAGARIAIYEFLDGKITDTGKKSFIPLDEKELSLLDREIKQKYRGKENRPLAADPTRPTSALKPQEQPKTNLSIDARPKTLDELKSRCPAELKGIDRSIWISTERQKYGI